MALSVSKTGDTVEVVERVYGFHTTRTRYWYYDLANNLRSMTGARGDVPNTPMGPREVEWVSRYYLPMLQDLANARLVPGDPE